MSKELASANQGGTLLTAARKRFWMLPEIVLVQWDLLASKRFLMSSAEHCMLWRFYCNLSLFVSTWSHKECFDIQEMFIFVTQFCFFLLFSVVFSLKVLHPFFVVVVLIFIPKYLNVFDGLVHQRLICLTSFSYC